MKARWAGPGGLDHFDPRDLPDLGCLHRLELRAVSRAGTFSGETAFTYTAENAAGDRDQATVQIVVHPVGQSADAPEVEPGDGFAKNDSASVAMWRSILVRAVGNDDGEGLRVIEVAGQPIAPEQTVYVGNGDVTMTAKGSLNFSPSRGMQMEPIWLPSPEGVVQRFFEIASEGYQNFTLWQHLGWSLLRVIVGFALGALWASRWAMPWGFRAGSVAGSIPSSSSCGPYRPWL
jgi:taurine transport system permease protein